MVTGWKLVQGKFLADSGGHIVDGTLGVIPFPGGNGEVNSDPPYSLVPHE